jgi:hypothetical protein
VRSNHAAGADTKAALAGSPVPSSEAPDRRQGCRHPLQCVLGEGSARLR